MQPSMRMSKAFLALLLVFSTLIPTAHAVDLPTTFSFQGSGYGHGVGLSQMGARYMANAGQSAEQIIKYFYKDVEIEPKDDSKILRVNIGNLISSAKISKWLCSKPPTPLRSTWQCNTGYKPSLIS